MSKTVGPKSGIFGSGPGVGCRRWGSGVPSLSRSMFPRALGLGLSLRFVSTASPFWLELEACEVCCRHRLHRLRLPEPCPPAFVAGPSRHRLRSSQGSQRRQGCGRRRLRDPSPGRPSRLQLEAAVPERLPRISSMQLCGEREKKSSKQRWMPRLRPSQRTRSQPGAAKKRTRSLPGLRNGGPGTNLHGQRPGTRMSPSGIRII